MRAFSSRLLKVEGDSPVALAPSSFQGRVDELTLETWIVGDPSLVGEPLLVLGRQLAEFQEDQDRLDVLAIDQAGEIVLIELKVAENFRVTDLQALAYAGAYASRTTEELARTLRNHLSKGVAPDDSEAQTPAALGTTNGAEAHIEPGAFLEQAKDRISSFLELDDFEEWLPSQHVRIKLIAPSFPRRVLKNVKWLGDVYDMPIEAITVRLFDAGGQRHYLAFERVLPLPSEAEFDLTVRQREERQREENVQRKRRGRALPLLVENGLLKDGDMLWVAKDSLLVNYRDQFDPEKIAFQVRVHAPAGTQPRLAWRSAPDAEVEILRPASVHQRVYEAALGWHGDDFKTPVASHFTLRPNGMTLEEVLVEHGLW